MQPSSSTKLRHCHHYRHLYNASKGLWFHKKWLLSKSSRFLRLTESDLHMPTLSDHLEYLQLKTLFVSQFKPQMQIDLFSLRFHLSALFDIWSPQNAQNLKTIETGSNKKSKLKLNFLHFWPHLRFVPISEYVICLSTWKCTDRLWEPFIRSLSPSMWHHLIKSSPFYLFFIILTFSLYTHYIIESFNALCGSCNGELSMINFQFLRKNVTFTF